MRRGAVAAAACAILLAAGAMVWALRSDDGDRAADRPDARGGNPAADAPLPRAPALALERGAHLAYEFEVESSGSADLDSLAAAARKDALPATKRGIEIRSVLRGRLEARVVDGEDGGLALAARLSGVSWEVNGRATSEAELAVHPFLCAVTPQGRQGGFRFVPGLPSATEGACRSALESIQWVFPEAPASAWSADEEDRSGAYRARYGVRASDAGATEMTRVKESYRPVSGGGPAYRTRVLRSVAVARLAAGEPWPSTFEGEEEIETLLDGRALARASTRTRARAVPPRPGEEPPADLAAARAALDDPFLLRASFRRTRPGLDAFTTGWSVDDAAKAFVEGSGDPSMDRDLLVNWLRQDPARCAALVRWLDANGASLALDRETGMWEALVAAGTAEAQQAVTAAFRDAGYADRSRMRAVSHAAFFECPEPPLADALWEVHRRHARSAAPAERTLSDSAVYAFGALGAPDRGNPAVRTRTAAELAAALDAAGDATEAKVLLGAAGNHGGASLLASLERHFDSPDPNVRAEAFAALRRIEGDAALEMLLRRYREEKSAGVRGAAMRALAERKPADGALEFARAHVLETSEDACLLPLVEFLGNSMAGRPENEAALKALLARGPSMDVRRALYRFIKPL